MNNLVIAADLGHFKAYRIIKDPLRIESPRIELIEAYDTIEGREKPGARYTDSPGAFRRKSSSEHYSSGGFGERHTLNNERLRRLLKLTANTINDILVREGMPKWHLCACKSINNSLIASLSKGARTRLKSNTRADLTKAEKSEILTRFTY